MKRQQQQKWTQSNNIELCCFDFYALLSISRPEWIVLILRSKSKRLIIRTGRKRLREEREMTQMSRGLPRWELQRTNVWFSFFQRATTERIERTRTSDHKEKEEPTTLFFFSTELIMNFVASFSHGRYRNRKTTEKAKLLKQQLHWNSPLDRRDASSMISEQDRSNFSVIGESYQFNDDEFSFLFLSRHYM